MSDFDLYPGQNCPCGNDPACGQCGSGAEAERMAQEEHERQEHAKQMAEEAAREQTFGRRPWHPTCQCGTCPTCGREDRARDDLFGLADEMAEAIIASQSPDFTIEQADAMLDAVARKLHGMGARNA